MKQTTSLDRLKIVLFLLSLFLSVSPVFADEEDLFSASASIEPNVLMIFDNSNSMDEDFVGNSVCSWVTGSRSVEGRRALINIVNSYADSMRLGLMSYRLPSANKYQLHNSLYFSSYEPKSYCPNPPVECSAYCTTGDATALAICQSSCSLQNSQFDATYRDEIITNYAVGSDQRIRYCNLIYPKRNRVVNPADTSKYVYYKLPGTFYATTNYGADFCYSSSYNASEGGSDSYQCYNTKTGTSDDGSGYSSASMSGSFYATDEDLALGFNDFGRRMAWTYSGRTWFANSSPGGGVLQVSVGDNNPVNNSQKNSLLAKLATKEGDETGYMSCNDTGNPNSCAYIVNAGLTPTAGSFRSAENYFKGVKDYKTNTNNTSPIQDWCQSNFIVYVTDGLPSVDENGAKGSAATLLPGVLGKIDNLRSLTKTIGSATYTFDVQTFVLGMALTDDARAHLDLMAVHGGADVDGHAYYASNAGELTTALNSVFSNIIERAYSFSTASVSSSRIQDENNIYETSFEPVNNDPFWRGYVKKYQLNSDGSVGAVQWEAGGVLAAASAASRSVYTRINSVNTEFTTANIGLTPNVLNLPSGSTEADVDAVVNYVRGEATPDNWKLGDTFHSNPITIGSPSPFFYDILDPSNVYATYRTNRERSSANGKRLLLTGSNDGQLHAFRTSDGAEIWSFIPPNLLPKLSLLAHSTHPTSKTHQFFVDGPITVADVWLGIGTKSWADWRTLAVVSLGRNDRDYTNGAPTASATKYWSAVSSCDSGLADGYSVSNPYYCGYHAFDFTNVGYGSTAPEYKWHLNMNSSQAPYAGEPWSRMSIGRVKINGAERWVGFIGAGFSGADCNGGVTCELRGKGFYVVDLNNGDVIWQYTRASNTANLEYDFAAAPAAADMDNDGYIDSVFAGDTGGNVWRFNMCKKTDGSTCGTSSWSGGLLMDKIGGSDKQPIYTSPTVTTDNNGQIWLYWGTGDKTDPTGNSPAGYFWAIKPATCSPTCVRSNAENITSSTQAYTDGETKIGWYINLAGQSEKILSDPVVFGGVVYFSSFVPAVGAGSCGQAGTAKMYAVKAFTGGGGVLDKTDATVRSVDVGGGIPSTPVISMRPGTAPSADIYLTISGGGGQKANTLRVNFDPPTLTTRGNMLFWRDRRIQ
jgi:type IV pilus assembly protein PilY1